MKQQIWALDQNGRLFAFCNFVRKFYEGEGIPKTTNLCSIFQSTIWGLLFLVVSLPAIMLGWLGSKLGRMLLTRDNWFSSCLSGTALTVFDEAPKSFKESPVISGWIYLFLSCMFFLIIPVGLIVGLGYVGMNIGSIVHAVFIGLCWIGWVIFIILGLIGGAGITCYPAVCFGAVWFWQNILSNVSFWLTVLFYIGCAIGLILGICLIGALLVVGCMLITRSRWWPSLVEWLSNGFDEKRRTLEHLAQDREELKKQKLMARPAWECFRCQAKSAGERSWCYNCSKHRSDETNLFIQLICDPFTFCWGKVGKTKDIEIKEATIRILGPFKMIGLFLWSIKKGLCPIVQVVDAEEIRRLHEEYKLKVPTLAEVMLFKGYITAEQYIEAKKQAENASEKDPKTREEWKTIEYWIKHNYWTSKEKWDLAVDFHNLIKYQKEVKERV